MREERGEGREERGERRGGGAREEGGGRREERGERERGRDGWMLCFERQLEFERWLDACPLSQRSLSYSVTRSGDDSLLAISCTWRTPALAARQASPPPLPVANSSAHQITSSESHPAADEVGPDSRDSVEEIATLQSNLERMRAMMNMQNTGEGSRPTPFMSPSIFGSPKGTAVSAHSNPSERTSPLISTLMAIAPSGSYDKARGEAALAAMMQAKKAGASTRDQVRACLSMSLGGKEYPRPPGAATVDTNTNEPSAPGSACLSHESPSSRHPVGGEDSVTTSPMPSLRNGSIDPPVLRPSPKDGG